MTLGAFWRTAGIRDSLLGSSCPQKERVNSLSNAMNIPTDPKHVRKRRQKYGPDGNFMTMPAPRPEPISTETFSEQQPAHVCREGTAVVTAESSRELVRL